jgi:ABC-type transporter Mla subunit MlaD
MQEFRRNLIVGAFVLLGLAALGVVIVLFGRGPTMLAGGEGRILNIHFDSAAGIKEGNYVTVGGLEVGRVRQVRFSDPRDFESGVLVEVLIDRGYSIPAGSTAIATPPVFGSGRPAVEIVPGPAGQPPLQAQATIPGRIRGSTESLFPAGLMNTLEKSATQIGDAAEALTPVLRETTDLLKRRSPEEVDREGGPQGNLSSAVARLDSGFKHVNEIIGDPAVQSQLRDAVANLHEISEDGKAAAADLRAAAGDAKDVVADARSFVKNADEAVTKIDARVTELASGTREAVDKASRFLDYINAAGEQLANGKGTVGRMFMEDKLYEELLLSVTRLANAIEEFRLLIADWQKGKIKIGL